MEGWDVIASPVTDRFQSLDILRGIAILGIFAVNILAFGFTFHVLANPSVVPVYNDAFGEFWYALSVTVFHQKFITIFSALFGAGIVLMLGEEKASPKISIHRRRMFWLLVIGMVHAHLFWYGDILVPYAVIGFLVARSRIWRVRNLLIAACILILINFGMFMLQGVSTQYMSPEELAEMKLQMWAPTRELLQVEYEKFRAGFFERIPFTIGNSVFFQIIQLVGFGARTAALMMIGMVLYRVGFLTLRWGVVPYLLLGVICSALGLFGSYWAVSHHHATDFSMAESLSGQAAIYWASLIQAFGYAAFIMGICKIDAFKVLCAPFAAMGRMALSNYLASTLIGVLIFYGPPGLGKIGTMNFSQLAMIVGANWVFMLIWSSFWLSIFRFGPAEWIWRSLTYWRLQPMFK